MKENQFFCVKCRARKMCNPENIGVKVYPNKRIKGGEVPTLKCKCPNCDTNMTKFIKHDSLKDAKAKYRKW